MVPCPSPCCASMAEEHSYGVIPGGGGVAILSADVTIREFLCWTSLGVACLRGRIVVSTLSECK